MVKRFLLSAMAAALYLQACHPGLIREQRTTGKTPTPDSTLYYTPRILADPFLDSLKTDLSTAVVYLTLTPPPQPPAPRFKTIDGYRVQLFAGVDSLNGKTLAAKLRNALNDSIYFFRDGALFKVQAGDFAWRNDADMKVLELRKKGYLQGWVVQRPINWPIDDSLKTTIVPHAAHKPASPVVDVFRIQVLVTGNKHKALQVKTQLEQQWKLPARIIHQKNLYKLVFGSFNTRKEAEEWRDKLKTNGYPDAWILHK